MNVLGAVGRHQREKWAYYRRLSALLSTVVFLSLRPGTFRRTVRNVLARQILFTGFEAARFVSLVAFLIGIAVVVQAQLWLTKVGQSALLGPVLVMVIVRELGPLLVNFIVIGRSGTAVATELGSMNVAGEVRVLDAQGLDPLVYLVIPRTLGVAISVFCLTVVFIVVSFLSGYLSGLILGGAGQPGLFLQSVFRAITPADVGSLIAKTLVPGLLTGIICCSEGLSVNLAITEVPQAATRAVVKSVTALFLTSVLISVFTYA